MDSIFHEKQEGQLCAQHCLNNLLQGPYFTAVSLASIARELDDAEQDRMAEGGVASQEYLKFMEQPSSNMDDSGYFSVQVISEALHVWNLDLTPFSSPTMKHAVEDPTTQTAYICNHDYHWLTVRKLGKQWFNLDSLQKKPKLISDTYLSLFLTQLQMEGYSIFVVVGFLPSCEADELLTLIPIEPEKEGPPRPQPSGREWKRPRGPKQPRKDLRQEGNESLPARLATAVSQLATAVSRSTAESKQLSRDNKLEEDFAVQLATAMSQSSEESGPYRRDYDQEEEDLAVQLATAMSESYSLALQKKKEEEENCEERDLSDKESDMTLVGNCADGDTESNGDVLATAVSASLDDQKDHQDASLRPVPSDHPDACLRPVPADHPDAGLRPVLSEGELREKRLLHLGEIPEHN